MGEDDSTASIPKRRRFDSARVEAKERAARGWCLRARLRVRVVRGWTDAFQPHRARANARTQVRTRSVRRGETKGRISRGGGGGAIVLWWYTMSGRKTRRGAWERAGRQQDGVAPVAEVPGPPKRPHRGRARGCERERCGRGPQRETQGNTRRRERGATQRQACLAAGGRRPTSCGETRERSAFSPPTIKQGEKKAPLFKKRGGGRAVMGYVKVWWWSVPRRQFRVMCGVRGGPRLGVGGREGGGCGLV